MQVVTGSVKSTKVTATLCVHFAVLSHREELATVEAERVLLSNKVNLSDQELHQQRQLMEQQKAQVSEQWLRFLKPHLPPY